MKIKDILNESVHPDMQKAANELLDKWHKSPNQNDWGSAGHLRDKLRKNIPGMTHKHAAAAHKAWADTKSDESCDESLKTHPQYTDADYEYLKGKGWKDSEIKKRWDEEKSAGTAPNTVNKMDYHAYDGSGKKK